MSLTDDTFDLFDNRPNYFHVALGAEQENEQYIPGGTEMD